MGIIMITGLGRTCSSKEWVFRRLPGILKKFRKFENKPVPITGGAKMAQITKEMLIGDILGVAPSSVPIFLDMGMYCLGCPASLGETLEQACLVHGVDVDEMVEKLNELAVSE